MDFVALKPTCNSRYYCQMRNPTTADVGTKDQRFLFLINLAVFGAGGFADTRNLTPETYKLGVASNNLLPA
jgi:hypothetical protein